VRNLRTSLLLQNAERPPKTIMFASSLPGEGKTTTAMLLAVLSRQMGKTAVVVDCDLRRRTLAKSVSGRGPAKGLVAVLEGSATLDQAIWVDADSGVHLLAPGGGERIPKNPADLLSSPRFRELIDELRASYDLVLFDTPPALVVTDARIVAQAMDAIVYLVAWNRTSKGAVNHGLRELASVSAKITGIALTRVDEARAARQIKNHFYYKRRYKDYLAS
jgi:polysaccharide biosynthesis transport protein